MTRDVFLKTGCQPMATDKHDVLYGTLGLMILKTLAALGPLHGYRIARRIEQISGDQLALNQGTLYPALIKLEQLGWIASKWGDSESGRRVKVYSLTREGRRQLDEQEAQWHRATSIVARFFKISEDLP
jgi:PadR family transcriptional regulator